MRSSLQLRAAAASPDDRHASEHATSGRRRSRRILSEPSRPTSRNPQAGVGGDWCHPVPRCPAQLQNPLRATPSIGTNSASICGRERRRNVAMVSWPGCWLAATTRTASESGSRHRTGRIDCWHPKSLNCWPDSAIRLGYPLDSTPVPDEPTLLRPLWPIIKSIRCTQRGRASSSRTGLSNADVPGSCREACYPARSMA